MQHKRTEDRPDLVIRTARAEDFPDVLVLQELEFSLHRRARPDYFRPLQTSYSEAEFRKLLSHPCPIALVAAMGEHVVGLCFGMVEEVPGNSVCRPRRIALVQDVVTLPDHRGRGIATALLEKARAQAIQAGAVSMELCVWGFNDAAVRLYEKLGMRVQYCRMEADLTGG